MSSISAVQKDDRDDSIVYVEVRRHERTIAKLRSKVDSGAEGNTLPLRMFCGMYSCHLTKDRLPNPYSVHNSIARLFAYNELHTMKLQLCTTGRSDFLVVLTIHHGSMLRFTSRDQQSLDLTQG